MFFQVYCFKNVGVTGYVEAFEMVQLEKQASYMGYLFRNRCTSVRCNHFQRLKQICILSIKNLVYHIYQFCLQDTFLLTPFIC